MKAFFANSWFKRDKEVTSWFKENIESLAVRLTTADPPSPTNPLSKIKKLIKQNEALIAIFTKRQMLKTQNKWTPPDYVVDEAVYAHALKMLVVVFIEKNVIYEGCLREITEFVKFDRDNLHKITKKLIQYIDNTKKEVGARKVALRQDPTLLRESHHYKYNRFYKKVTIFKNGHGIIIFDCIIEVLSNKFDGFECSLGLDDWSYKRVKLERFHKLCSKDSSKRFSEQTFTFKLISPQFNCRLSPLKNQDKNSFKTIKVSIPKGFIKKGQTIHYTWGWSCPKLFPYLKGELYDNFILSTQNVKTKTDKFIYQINIEKGSPILMGNLCFEDWNISQKARQSIVVPVQNESLYYVLSEITLGESEPNTKCVFKWLKH